MRDAMVESAPVSGSSSSDRVAGASQSISPGCAATTRPRASSSHV
jgi:hypothetical protein